MEYMLYSNDCPRCQILKERLDEQGIEYEKNSDTELLTKNNIFSFPALKIGEKILRFYDAIRWLKQEERQ